MEEYIKRGKIYSWSLVQIQEKSEKEVNKGQNGSSRLIIWPETEMHIQNSPDSSAH